MIHPERGYYQWNDKKELQKNEICICGDIKKKNQNTCDECHEKKSNLSNDEFYIYVLEKMKNSKS